MGAYPYSTTQRTSKIKRATKETQVAVEVNVDGMGKASVKTGLSFIDHLIVAIANHGMIDIILTAISNDGILHHLVEDVSIEDSVMQLFRWMNH